MKKSKTQGQSLPDFTLLKDVLADERKAIVKVNNFSSEEENEYVREVADAEIILNTVKDISEELALLFTKYPSLMGLFDKEFTSFREFVTREHLFKLVFLEDCLFPEKELFLFGQDGGINPDILKRHRHFFKEWGETRKSKHEETQELLKKHFHLEIKETELECPCSTCRGDYRNAIKEFVLQQSIALIDKAEEQLTFDTEDDLDKNSDIFLGLKKDLDKGLYKIRYRLRRGAYSNLNGQIRGLLIKKLTFPSALALKREEQVLPILKQDLMAEGFGDNFLDQKEFKKFFTQIQINLWRNREYILREFKKIVRSLTVLKRKDISGKILQQYIGEFWVHSQARTIQRKIVYHMGPTNSGKTYHAIKALSQVQKGCYLAPLRLLAAELYDTMNAQGVMTTLLTGEEVIEVEGATHYSSTIEMAQLQEVFDCCVIDEIQMITDSQRGWAWTRALVNIFSPEIHICGDPTVLELIEQIVELCGDRLEIKTYERMTDLKIEKGPIPLANLGRSDALVVFSRRNALKYKRDLEALGLKVSIVYGRLSPEVRREQARKFDSGETDVIVSTDAIAMGMNLPIKKIVFSTLSKFIDSQEIPISNSEIKQIAGRAGRYQRFPVGYITTLTKVEDGIAEIQEAMNSSFEQQKKCMVGPDLDIFSQISTALEENNFKKLRLSEFLRLFNTMTFKKPFYCVELKEMIELSEMVEDADSEDNLSMAESFGLACAPVNLGILEHVQYYVWILNNFVHRRPIPYDPINYNSSNIDYLETSIKCVELYQWLARHFKNKNFSYVEADLLDNKTRSIERLNELLGEKTVLSCSSCGVNLPENSTFSICENCFKKRRFSRKRNFSRKRSSHSSSQKTRSTRSKHSLAPKTTKRKGRVRQNRTQKRTHNRT